MERHCVQDEIGRRCSTLVLLVSVRGDDLPRRVKKATELVAASGRAPLARSSPGLQTGVDGTTLVCPFLPPQSHPSRREQRPGRRKAREGRRGGGQIRQERRTSARPHFEVGFNGSPAQHAATRLPMFPPISDGRSRSAAGDLPPSVSSSSSPCFILVDYVYAEVVLARDPRTGSRPRQCYSTARQTKSYGRARAVRRRPSGTAPRALPSTPRCGRPSSGTGFTTAHPPFPPGSGSGRVRP